MDYSAFQKLKQKQRKECLKEVLSFINEAVTVAKTRINQELAKGFTFIELEDKILTHDPPKHDDWEGVIINISHYIGCSINGRILSWLESQNFKASVWFESAGDNRLYVCIFDFADLEHKVEQEMLEEEMQKKDTSAAQQEENFEFIES